MAYSQAKVQLKLTGQRVDVEQFSLDAAGFQVAATGNVNIEAKTLDLNVLVAPVQTINGIVSKIPIIRDIFGGSVLAIPVKVRGSFDSPTVVPLGAEAVGSRLVGILGNTLKLPTKLVPSGSKDSTQAAPPAPPAPPPASPPPR
jgi:hypothetical protein